MARILGFHPGEEGSKPSRSTVDALGSGPLSWWVWSHPARLITSWALGSAGVMTRVKVRLHSFYAKGRELVW